MTTVASRIQVIVGEKKGWKLLVSEILFRSSVFDRSVWMRTGAQERVTIEAGSAQVAAS